VSDTPRGTLDQNDYIRFVTTSDIPEITTVGTCDLKISSSGDTIRIIDDLDIEDDTPHLTFVDTDDTPDTAYQWHLDTSTDNIPWQNYSLWRGTHDGTFSVDPNKPLMYFDDDDDVYFPTGDVYATNTLTAEHLTSTDDAYITDLLGVGTTTPAEKLTLSDTKGLALQIESTTNDNSWSLNDEIASLEFYSKDTSGTVGAGVKGALRLLATDTYGAESIMTFSTCDNITSDIERMRIDNDGLVNALYDVQIDGNLGVGGTATANYNADITMAATDTRAINIDGVTNDYSTASAGYGIYNFRDMNWGTSDVQTYYGFNNRIFPKNTDATLPSNTYWYAVTHAVTNTGSVTNTSVDNRYLYLRSFDLTVTDTGTYDTDSTGRILPRMSLSRLYLNADPTLVDTGNQTPQSSYNTVGHDILIDVNPASVDGDWVVYSYGLQVSVTGTDEGTSQTRAINIVAATGGDGNFAVYDDSGAEWRLDSDNQKFRLGETQGDFDLYSDGTDGVITTGTNLDIIPTGVTTIGDGGTTNYTEIGSTGDQTFVGSAGLPFAEIYANDVADELTITTAGQANKVQITSFAVDGVSNNMTPDHTNDHITVVKAGMYLCNVSMSVSSAAAGGADNIGFAVYKNNGATEFPNCHGHRTLGGGGTDRSSCSMSGIIDLAVDDTIEVWVWNEDSTDNLVVDDATLSLVQCGGT